MKSRLRSLANWSKLIGTVLSVALLSFAFQNCSPIGKSSNLASKQQMDGGQGIDGKTKYLRAGVCPGSNATTSDAVLVANDLSSAQITRQNCVDLPNPISVPISSLGFAFNESSVFVLSQGIYTTGTDGSALAPAGPAQFPNLLANYIVRPSWNVAGVDYAVGPNQGTTLKDPLTINIPGVTFDNSTHEVIIDADDVTLDGYDFSLHGGWTVTIGERVTTHNTKILNSNFKVGSNHAPMIYAAGSTTNVYFGYCTFDGNNTEDSLADTAIFFEGTDLTVEYSMFKNSPGAFMETGSGTIVVRYNVFTDSGQAANSGGNWMQLGAGEHYVVSDFNTYYQTKATTGPGTDGLDVSGSTYKQAWTINSAQVLNNTIVTLAGALVDSDITIGTDFLVGTALVRGNFVDPTGSAQFAEPGSSCAVGSCKDSPTATSIFLDNFNMITGLAFANNP